MNGTVVGSPVVDVLNGVAFALGIVVLVLLFFAVRAGTRRATPLVKAHGAPALRWLLGPRLTGAWSKAQIRSTRLTGAVDYVREPIPQRVRHEVWRRDQGRCVDCGSRERLEFDHIIAVSRGGSNTARNIELRCERCNRTKGARV